MKLYLGLLIWIGFCALITYPFIRKTKERGMVEYRPPKFLAVIYILPLVIFSGFRTYVNDTETYIWLFDNTPTGWPSVISFAQAQETGKGFYFLCGIFRTFISTTYYHWFLLFAIIFGLAIFKVYYRYSSSFALTMFLFMASGAYTWFFTGMRQFLAVCIIFSFSDYLIKENTNVGIKRYINKNSIEYCIMVLLCYFIHSSALIMIPVYFLVQGKPWEKKMVMSIVGMILVIVFLDSFTGLMGDSLEDSYYSDVTGDFSQDKGTNPVRVLVMAIPTVIAFISRKKISEKSTPMLNVCINMSVFSTGFYVFAMFTNGITMGRVPIYMELYNYILMPWLLKNVFDKREQTWIVIIAIALYSAYFYYDIAIARTIEEYFSSFLGLFFY